MWLSNITGILQLVTPFLSGAPPPKKNPGSAPVMYNINKIFNNLYNLC